MTWNEAIDNFKTYLTLEKSLSSNSVEAYLNDIKKLAAFSLQSEPQLQPEEITYATLTTIYPD